MLKNYNATQTDPTDIARRDNIEFFVEKVLSYKRIFSAKYLH